MATSRTCTAGWNSTTPTRCAARRRLPSTRAASGPATRSGTPTSAAQTSSSRWNALGLGTTAHFARPLVYNTKRSGTFELGGRRFTLRRVAFPPRPPPEWFVVDLFENAGQADTSPESLVQPLAQALREGRFDPEQLRRAAERYGTRATRNRVAAALAAAGSSCPPR